MKVETPHRRERIDQRLLDERSRDRMARERRNAVGTKGSKGRRHDERASHQRLKITRRG
jgi:hypothetical protein